MLLLRRKVYSLSSYTKNFPFPSRKELASVLERNLVSYITVINEKEKEI